MRLVMSPVKTIDFRVSTLPTLFGEKTVMRILDATQAQMGIDALGYDPDQKELLLEAIQLRRRQRRVVVGADVGVAGDLGGVGEFLQLPLKRGDQALMIEDAGPQVGDDAAHLRHGGLDLAVHGAAFVGVSGGSAGVPEKAWISKME